MKWKVILTVVLSTFLIGGITMYALAGTLQLDTGASTALVAPSGSSTGITISPSSKVSMYFITNSGTWGDGSGTTYAISSCHEQGDKEFGVAANSSAIYFLGIGLNACTSGGSITLTQSDSSAFTGTGWVSL